MNLEQFKKDSKYLMLALDHRGSFKKLMNPGDPDSVTDEEIIDLKSEIIKSVEDQMSGVLIDVDWGKKAYQGEKPFLLPAERSGYEEDLGGRISELEYSVSQLKEMGASGVKLLIYFNPKDENSHLQLATANHVLKEAKEEDLPLFLEIVTYGGEGLTLESLQRFVDASVIPDVFKLEYPGSFEECQKITQMLGPTPWILLTRGDTFEVFKKELEEAIKGGCQGFLAGRALWQEVCSLKDEEKERFSKEVLPQRFKEISEVVFQAR